MAVVRPIASRNMRTDANAFRAICIAWVVILVGAIPVLIIHGEVSLCKKFFVTLGTFSPPNLYRSMQSSSTFEVLIDDNIYVVYYMRYICIYITVLHITR